MKDKIVKLHNQKDYYILEEVEYQDKLYALAAECNVQEDTMNEDELFLFEIQVNKDHLVVKEVEDEELAKKIVQEFQKKVAE